MPMAAAIWPLAVHIAAAIGLAATVIALSHFVGTRHRERATGEPYESGIVSTGGARLRLASKFYLMAMFFVVFDLEAAYLLAWAVAAREVGWSGYVEMLVFVTILLAALVYLWRSGALDWGPPGRRPGSSTPKLAAKE